MNSNDLLSSLTAAQRDAVTHVDGPLLILAGPGSGKTRVVTHRVAYLLEQGIAARQILALTFTNKSAEEMKSRLASLAPGEPVWVGTFHRFCSRLLREFAPLVGLEPNFTIYDTADSRNLLKVTLAELDLNTAHATAEEIAHAISFAKNNLISASEYQPRVGNPVGISTASAYPAYQRNLLGANAVDFDDLLLHVGQLLRGSPEVRAQLDARYRYILVDEYQDTNLVQYLIVRALSQDYPNLAVTGDPDQSIYGWRGANLKNILDFESDYAGVRVVRLEQNYRSTQRILRASAELISHNKRRKEKALFTENEAGEPVRLTLHESNEREAEAIAARIARQARANERRPSDFAIFYRVNALSRTLEQALRAQGVPYQITGSVEFYQRKEIKDVLAYLLLLNNPRDEVAFRRIVNVPARGIGETTLARLAAHARTSGQSLLEAARESGLVAGIAKKTAVTIARFVALLDRLQLLARRPIEEILGHVLTESGYQESLSRSNTPENQERLANIEELLSAARHFDEQNPGEGHLEEYLEQAALVNETDDWESTADRVTLMTLHASKGLEFPVVFIVALEQGLLPHERAMQDADEMEEERRLLFVGMTRARQELHLSLAKVRDFRGRRGRCIPSPFLFDLPREEMLLVGVDDVQGSDPAAADAAHSHDDATQETGHEEPVWTAPDDGALERTHETDTEVEAGETAMATAPRERPSPRPVVVRLTTAAELAGTVAADPASPEDFRLGMTVRHPGYGLGKIVALSGSARSRTAKVQFPGSSEPLAFVLRSCELKPVK